MDACTHMVQTTDGGFALLGFAHSFGTDAWLVKTDEYGNMEWKKTIGGATSFIQTSDGAASFIQTLDGGFAFVGTNASPVEGYIPVGRLPDGFWSYVWLAKTDEYGNMEWNKTYDGETGYYHGSSLVQTADGGYALVGNSFSSFGDYDDFLLIKTDSYGNREWSKLYDYSEHESGSGLIQTFDEGFVLASKTYSLGERPDIWVTKTDESGNIEWIRVYSDSRMVSVTSLIQLSDGSFILAGGTDTFGDRGADFYLTKIDNNGNIEWTQTYGTENLEHNPSLVQTSDGGFALAGYMVTSSDHDLADFLLVRADNRGNMLWTQTYLGGAVLGYPSLIQTVDGGFALSGGIGSFENGDFDFWLIKTDASSPPLDTTSPTISVISPENKTYTENNVSLTFTVNELTSWIGYSLDEQANVTITGNTTLTGLPDAPHSLVVYATDTDGNTGASETINFSKVTPPPDLNGEIFLITNWIFWGMIIVAVVGAVLLVYFRKIKKSKREMSEPQA